MTRLFFTAIAGFVLLAMVAPIALAEGPVPRVALTSAIEDREPIDVVSHVPATSDHIYYFSELSGQAGRTIIHRWLHEGNNYGDVHFDIGGDRWRVWSRKQLTGELHGDWRVQIVDAEDERVLRETRFTYGESHEAPAPDSEAGAAVPAAAEEDATPEPDAPTEADPDEGEEAAGGEPPPADDGNGETTPDEN